MVVEVQAETVIINKAERWTNGGPHAGIWLENRYRDPVTRRYTVKIGDSVKSYISGRAVYVYATRVAQPTPSGLARWRGSLRPADGNTIIVTSRGSIDTSRNSTVNYGILAGNRNRITNFGRIKTRASGIAIVSDNTVTNRGSITTTGYRADGIGPWSIALTTVSNNRNTITNRGTITTTGVGANGIWANDYNTIINRSRSRINTKGSVAYGIMARFHNIITNSGAINTKGKDARGISILDQSTVTNRGRINTKGNHADGISGFRDNNITNHGAINTYGEGAHGIRARDDNPVIVNETGAILHTGGHAAAGIWARDKNKITNRSHITTAGDADSKGDGGHGIQARTHNTIHNEQGARIHTRGANAAGIRAGVSLREDDDLRTKIFNATNAALHRAEVSVSLTGGHNTIRNDGNIQTTGANAAGIQVTGKGNHVTNTGRIHTTGRGAAGLLAVNVSNTQSQVPLETVGPLVRRKLTLQIQTDNTRLFNSGDITTTGDKAPGIRVSDNSNVTNSRFGSINTEGEGAHGILARDKNTVTNSGAINTKGDLAGGILAVDNNTITNSGTINTEGDLAGGILAVDNNTITNSGTINIKGDSFVFGIQAGDNNTITNSGTIKIKGIGRNFITISSFGSLNTGGIRVGDNNTVTNNGSGRINTEGDNADGIFAGDNNTVTNSGAINTEGEGADGIRVNDNNRVLNSGTINTKGKDAAGILVGPLKPVPLSTGHNNEIINDGIIFTTGANAAGIRVFGRNAVANTGLIHTTGQGAAGLRAGYFTQSLGPILVANRRDVKNTLRLDIRRIVGDIIIDVLGQRFLGADKTQLLNTGQILTTGANAPGIQISNKINLVHDIYGRIYVAGPGSAGIRAGNDNLLILRGSITSARGRALVLGDNNIINHSGNDTLRSTGQDTPAVVMGDGNMLINTGRIEATGTGANAHGIAGGSNNTLHNSGTISARGGKAVNLSGRGNTLNLLPGAALIGDMNLGPGGRVLVDTAPVNSVFWHGITARPEKRSEGAPFFYNARTRQLATYDIRALAASAQVLGDASGNVSGLMARPGLESATRRRSLIPTASGSALWLRAFGNRARYRGRGRGDLNPEAGHLGLAGGYDLRLNTTQFGLLAGYGRGELRFEGTQRFRPGPSLFKGPFAGVYVRRDFAPFSVQVGLAGGSLRHESSRLINDNRAPNGLARAEAHTRSWWLAPEARVGLRLDAGLMQFEPSFTARYARQSIRGFSETGIRAPATVGQRKVELLETRLELKTVREVGPGRIALKAGWQYRDDLNSNQAEVRLLGESQRVRLESGLGSSLYLGAEAEFELAPGLFLNLSGEAVSGDGYRNMSGMASVYQAF